MVSGRGELARIVEHRFILGDWRTFWNAGMAMAANRPMMTTTIMISTSVKPDLERVFIIFIMLILVSTPMCIR